MSDDFARAMYNQEPCRICGEMIEASDDIVFAGYSADCKSRAAHRNCWENRPPQNKWAYPNNEVK